MRRFSIRQTDSPEVRVARRAVAWTAVAASLFVAGVYLAPWIEAVRHPAGQLLRWFYAPLCHQMPERSFAFAGLPLAVCARCAGLYWGGAMGLLAAVWLMARRGLHVRPVWLGWAVAPTVVDALLPWIGLPGLSSLPRYLLAWPPGFVAGLFLAVGVEDLVLGLMSRRAEDPRPRKPHEVPVLEEFDG